MRRGGIRTFEALVWAEKAGVRMARMALLVPNVAKGRVALWVGRIVPFGVVEVPLTIIVPSWFASPCCGRSRLAVTAPHNRPSPPRGVGAGWVDFESPGRAGSEGGVVVRPRDGSRGALARPLALTRTGGRLVSEDRHHGVLPSTLPGNRIPYGWDEKSYCSVNMLDP